MNIFDTLGRKRLFCNCDLARLFVLPGDGVAGFAEFVIKCLNLGSGEL